MIHLTKTCMKCHKEMPWETHCPCLIAVGREIRRKASDAYKVHEPKKGSKKCKVENGPSSSVQPSLLG